MKIIAIILATLTFAFSAIAQDPYTAVGATVKPIGSGYAATDNDYHKGGWHMYATTDEVPDYLLADGMAIYASDTDQLFLRWAGDWREIMPANHNHSITNIFWNGGGLSGPFPRTNAFLMQIATNAAGDSYVGAVPTAGNLAGQALLIPSFGPAGAPSVLWSAAYPSSEYGTRWTNNPRLSDMSITNLLTVKAITLNGLPPITNWPMTATNTYFTNSTPAYQYWLKENGTNVLVTTDGTYTHKEYYSTEDLLEDPGAPLMSLISEDFVQRSGDTMTGELGFGNDLYGQSVDISSNFVRFKDYSIHGDDSIWLSRGAAGTPEQNFLHIVHTVSGNPVTGLVWTSDSDGYDSGLDADLLDGQDSGYYVADYELTSQLTNYVAKFGSRMYGPLTNGYIRYTSNGIEGWSANSSDIRISTAGKASSGKSGSIILAPGQALAGAGGDIVLAPSDPYGAYDKGITLVQSDMTVTGSLDTLGPVNIGDVLDMQENPIEHVGVLSSEADISLQPAAKVQVDGALEVIGDTVALGTLTLGGETRGDFPQTNNLLAYGEQDGNQSFGTPGWGLYDSGGAVYEYFDDGVRVNQWPLWAHGYGQDDMDETPPELLMRISDAELDRIMTSRSLVASNAIAGYYADSDPAAGASAIAGYGRSIQFDAYTMYSQPATPWRLYNIELDGDINPRLNRDLDMQGHNILNAGLGGTLTLNQLTLSSSAATNLLAWGANNWLGFQPPTGSTVPRLRGYYSNGDGYNRGVVLQMLGGDLMVHGAVVATNGVVSGGALDMRTNNVSGIAGLYWSDGNYLTSSMLVATGITVAVGTGSSGLDGVAVGPNAAGRNHGVGVGRYAHAIGVGNVAIGSTDNPSPNSNRAYIPAGYTDTVQLGRGEASRDGWLHFRTHPIVDADGNILASNLTANSVGGLATPIGELYATTNGIRVVADGLAAYIEMRGTNLYFTATNGVTGRVMLEFE